MIKGTKPIMPSKIESLNSILSEFKKLNGYGGSNKTQKNSKGNKLNVNQNPIRINLINFLDCKSVI